MITLTEKRLHELENRLPQYEAKILDLQKQLDAKTTNPKDIAELKDLLKYLTAKTTSATSVLNDASEQHAKNYDALTKTLSAHTEHLRTHADAISCANVNINAHTSDIDKVRGQVGQLRSDHCDTRERILSLSAASEGHLRGYNQCAQFANEAKSKFTELQGKSAALQAKLDDHDNSFSLLSNNMQTMQSALSFRLDNILNEIMPLLKPKETVAPKSYDAEIAEIRKDIAAILSIVHSTASQAIPPAPKVDDKIKAMETAIAQIYGLLKKYER